jgi:hypothetical protein
MWWHAVTKLPSESWCTTRLLPPSSSCLDLLAAVVSIESGPQAWGVPPHSRAVMLPDAEEIWRVWMLRQKGENCAAPKKLWTINGDALCMGWPSPRSPSRALQSLGLHLDLHVSIFGGYVDCELRWNQTHEHQAKEPHLMSKRKHFTLHSS